MVQEHMTWEPQEKIFHSKSAKTINIGKILPLREQTLELAPCMFKGGAVPRVF